MFKKGDFVKNIKYLCVLFCLLFIDSLMAKEENSSNMIEKKIMETSKNISDAIKNNRIYDIYGKIGMTTLTRDNKSPDVELSVDTLYEGTIGVVLLPDSMKFDISYKTSLNQGSSTAGSRENTDSEATTLNINFNVAIPKKYGYIDLVYKDIRLNGTLKNTSSSSVFVLDRNEDKYIGGLLPFSKTQELKSSQEIATQEKSLVYLMNYRFLKLPFLGINFGYLERELPVVIKQSGYTFAFAQGKAQGNIFGIGYYRDFEKAKKNKLLIKGLSYHANTLDVEVENKAYNTKVKGKNSVKIYLLELGYKVAKVELILNTRYTDSKIKDLGTGIEGFDMTEYSTNFLVKYTF